jgi:osmotically inducible protein OsmC
MAVRTSKAQWTGKLKDGKGKMKLGSGAFEGGYSFSSRFENGKGTNPEELIAAAHAGCFSMALAHNLEQAGYDPESISTACSVHLDKVGDGFKITSIDLQTKAKVPDIDEHEFQKHAEDAKENCPVSQALSSVEISMKAELGSEVLT